MKQSLITRRPQRLGAHQSYSLHRQRFMSARRIPPCGRWLPSAVRPPVQVPYQSKLLEVSRTANLEAPAFKDLADTWHCIEDLWIRLAVLCPVSVSHTADAAVVRFANVVAPDWDDESLTLIGTVMDPATYGWQQEGRSGSLVSWIELARRDLELRLVPASVLCRLPVLDDIGCQVQAFLVRLKGVQS
jgi:hypothetical protein